jgi:hypothetical protein
LEGSRDWTKSREICGFTDSADQEIDILIATIIEFEDNDDHQMDDNAKDDDHGNGRDRAEMAEGDVAPIRRRFVRLTRLRCVLLKYSEEGMNPSRLYSVGGICPSEFCV